MKHYAGIDGGGTKTKLLIINEKQEKVFEHVAGPTSIDTVSLSTVQQTFQGLFKGYQGEPLTAIFAGIGGVANAQDEKAILAILKTLEVVSPNTMVKVNNDVINALAGTIGHDEGMVLIAGTGSAVYGHTKGKSWRAGGISAKEGDPGSAYDLGFQALRHLGKVIDGRCPATTFSQDLMTSLHIKNYQELAQFFQQSDRTQIASLSPIVTRHDGDPYAQGIMHRAIDELVLMVSTVYNRLGFQETELGFAGSLANANTPFKAQLIQAIKKTLPTVTIIAPPRFDPVFGSALLAMRLEKNK
jgi:N-acetylglucosamine kinase